MSIEEKYNIIYKNGSRYYKYYLVDNRRSDLEKTRPDSCNIEGHLIEDNSWVNLLTEVCKYLLEVNPKENEELYSFKAEWYDKLFFTKTKLINFTEVRDGLYMNTNLGSVRSYWFLCDLISYFGLSNQNSYLEIKRFGISEAKEVRDYITAKNLSSYKDYLLGKYNEDKVDKMISLLKRIDEVSQKKSTTYYSILIIDEKHTLYNAKNELLNYYKKNLKDRTQYPKIEACVMEYYDFMYKRIKVR